MFKKNIKLFASTSFLVLVLCSPFFVFTANGSETILNKLETVGDKGGYETADETTLASTLGLIVNAILSLLGVIFIILIIYGGIKWMMAGGNEEDVKKATTIIKNAIIGLIITVSAYAIWSLIDRFFIEKF